MFDAVAQVSNLNQRYFFSCQILDIFPRLINIMPGITENDRISLAHYHEALLPFAEATDEVQKDSATILSARHGI